MRAFHLLDGRPQPNLAVGRVAFHPDGTRVLAQSGRLLRQACHWTTALHQIDISSGQVRTHKPSGQPSYDTVVSPDGRFAATAVHFHAGAVVLRLTTPWDGGSETRVRLAENEDATPWLGFGPDAALYAAVNHGGMNERTTTHTTVFRVDPGRAIRDFADPTSPKSHAFPPHPSGLDADLILDGATARVARSSIPLAHDVPPAFSVDGRWVATWSRTGPVWVFELGTGRLAHEVPWPGKVMKWHTGHRIALAPDGETIAMIGGGLLVCRRVDGSGKPWRTKRPVGYVTHAAFDPAGRTLIAVDRKGQAHRFDVRTGKRLAGYTWEQGMLLCVAVSPDGTLAATGGEGGVVVVWDLDY